MDRVRRGARRPLIVRTVPACGTQTNGTRPGRESREGWFFGINCLTKYVRCLSCAARRCVLSRRIQNQRTHAPSTSMKTVSSTKLSSPLGEASEPIVRRRHVSAEWRSACVARANANPASCAVCGALNCGAPKTTSASLPPRQPKPGAPCLAAAAKPIPTGIPS
jgi:hypothetical protein